MVSPILPPIGESRTLLLRQAFLGDRFVADLRLVIEDGWITTVEAGGSIEGAEIVEGIALPGLPNLHSHAFQRGMAGLAERRGPVGDSFWTWREVMYRFLAALRPEDVEAIADLAFAEMLEAGFTVVGEFHYLHHGVGGVPYDDPAELSSRIVAAAARTGIGLTLLPCFYAQGGFGDAPPTAGQARFVNDRDGFERLLHGAVRHAARWPGAKVGVAPHSLRAVSARDLAAIATLSPDGPVHIHAAEQTREVEDCLASTGLRPVEWLLAHADVDPSWCLIHATHLTADETEGLAASGAVAGLCPVTEASLGDGTFPGPGFMAAGGRFGIGTDSNISIDGAGELRQLEYAQRLARRGRNLMVLREGQSTGTALFREAQRGGAQALAQTMGAFAPGHRGDVVVLDDGHPAFAGGPETWLDAWIFGAGREAVETVVAAGGTVVAGGRHRDRDEIVRRYRAVLRRLVGAPAPADARRG
jgi:formimidoylglutamate deiminase